MTTHSGILAWKIPWTEEFGRLQPMGSKESDTTERLSGRAHRFSRGVCLVPFQAGCETTWGPFYSGISTNSQNLCYSHFRATSPGGSGEGDGTPLQYSCLENPMDGGAW